MAKCEVCSEKGDYKIECKDWKVVKKFLFLNFVSNEKHFCKKHCYETFEKLFLGNKARTVVFRPFGKDKKNYDHYMFANLEMTKQDFMVNDLSQNDLAKIYPKAYEVLKSKLDSAPSTCQGCSAVSNIVYYPIVWDEFVKNIDMEPEYLCPKCAFEKIKDGVFEPASRHFIAPHNTDYGIYVGILV